MSRSQFQHLGECNFRTTGLCDCGAWDFTPELPDGETREAALQRLSDLVYVPGLWHCPKCRFELLQANLNAANGSVTARDQPGDKCPNCHTALWRVTERDAGNRLCDRIDAMADELNNARARIAELETGLLPFAAVSGIAVPRIAMPPNLDRLWSYFDSRTETQYEITRAHVDHAYALLKRNGR